MEKSNKLSKQMFMFKELHGYLIWHKYQNGPSSLAFSEFPLNFDTSTFLVHLFQLNFNNYASLSLMLLIRPTVHFHVGKQTKRSQISQSFVRRFIVISITWPKLSIQNTETFSKLQKTITGHELLAYLDWQ